MEIFKLTRVKKLRGVGMEISYSIVEETSDITTTNKYKIELTEQPHDDLLTYFQNFGNYLAATLHLETDEFIETEEIKMMGNGDNESLIIKGKYYTDNDLTGTAISPRLRLCNDTFGFEMQMQNRWEHLTDEVKAFLFDGKRGELESFN